MKVGLSTGSIFFVRRQSPDWQGLSNEKRRGAQIDPCRYLPDHYIPGFPDRVDLLIEEWNSRFGIDFFTFRHVLAKLSRQSVASVAGTQYFTFEQLQSVAEIAKQEDAYVYFHDDDDFFAPSLPQVVRLARTQPDAIVTPMFRVACDGDGVYTLVMGEQCMPAFVWGRRIPHGSRYQTNNYGVASRRCRTLSELTSLKDHMLASSYADQNEYCDEELPFIISGTIKTPASASALQIFSGSSDSHKEAFDKFIEHCRRVVDLPESHSWFAKPLREIIRLVECVHRGDRYDAISDLLDPNPKS